MLLFDVVDVERADAPLMGADTDTAASKDRPPRSDADDDDAGGLLMMCLK